MKKYLQFIFQHKRLTFLIVFLFLFFVVPNISSAATNSCGTGLSLDVPCHINFLVKVVLSIIGFLVVFAQVVADQVLGWIINLIVSGVSYTSLDPLRNAAVALGWPIARDFANIIIVLGFVAIAVATILRFKDYEAKALLVKLIIAALLVNFSLVICGLVIDASHIAMRNFLNTNQTFIQGVTEQFEIIDGAVGDNTVTVTSFGLTIISTLVVGLMRVVVYALFIMLFLFRVIALWILVILSPIAFVCYVFPITKKVWDMWWSNFIQWVIVGIPGAFFLYLSKQIGDAQLLAPPRLPNGIPDGLEAIGQGFTNLFMFLVPGLFLVVGFIFSLQISAMGGSVATGVASKVGGYAKAGGKWAGKWAADNSGATRLKDRAVYGMNTLGERVGVLNRGTADAHWKKTTRASQVDEAGRKERTGEMTFEQKQAHLAAGAITTEGHLDNAAILKSLSKEEWAQLSHGQQMEYLQKYESYGVKPHEAVANMSTLNQNQIVAGNMFSPKAREEAMKALAAKGQLDSSLPGALTQAQIMDAVEEMQTNGVDTKDVVTKLTAGDKRHIIRNGLLNEKSRGEALSSLAEKGQLDSSLPGGLTQAEIMTALEETRLAGGDVKSVVNKLNAADQAHIIQSGSLDRKSRGEALNGLAAKGQLNMLSQAQIVAAMDEVRGGGGDLKDVIGALNGLDMADMLMNRDFDAPTRAKILKALADKKQLDLMSQGEQIALTIEAQAHGVKPQDITSKMSSENQAHVVNNGLLTPDARGKAVESLMKKRELNLIAPANRAAAYQEAVNSGTDIEDIEAGDYRAAPLNGSRMRKIVAANPLMTTAQHEQAARDQTLDENIGSYDGDQLRDIGHTDLAFAGLTSPSYSRVKKLTPEKI